VDNITIYFDDNPSFSMRMSGRVSSPSSLSNNRHQHQEGVVDLGIVSVPSPRIWSTTDPQLHTVSVEMNGAVVTERFGLRYWDIQSNHNSDDGTTTSRIRLNGHVLKLVGWNHHTQWPKTAASPTDEEMDQDITMLKEQGHVNFVRGAHYPQDPRWLDRLDEAGIVMWCETLGPGTTVKNMQDDFFIKYQIQQVNEMMDSAMNHASIAFWAFFNEGPSQYDEACVGYQATADAINARDPTRFITYASDRFPHDKCYDVATVISHNGYPGWYNDGTPADHWNAVAKFVSTTGKPFVISEAGAAGIYEWTRNDTVTKWTLEYQSRIISQDVDVALANPLISGIALWHFFDFKVNDGYEHNTHCDYLPNVDPPTCGYINVNTSTPFGRPGGMNHKGSVDFYRRPKPIFPIVAAKYKNVTVS
jgi:beta-glucuronidase